jgi:hypothetical protein
MKKIPRALISSALPIIVVANQGSVFAADSGLDIALKLAHSNLICSQVSSSLILFRPDHSSHPSVEICAFRQALVKTQNGIRLLLASSITDANKKPTDNYLYWTDVDCKNMLSRVSDGYYYALSKSLTPTTGRTQIFPLTNGWNLYQTKKYRGEWESMKVGPHDKSLMKACELFF